MQSVFRPKFLLMHKYDIYRAIDKVCGESNIAPLWELYSTEIKVYNEYGRREHKRRVYEDARKLIYETEDNSMKIIQNIALYVLALNCGIIAYWFRIYQPIFNDFQTNHGAKNANGERNGQPRTIIRKFGKHVGLNRFIILVSFLSKILIPFVDSITGKSKRQSVNAYHMV